MNDKMQDRRDLGLYLQNRLNYLDAYRKDISERLDSEERKLLDAPDADDDVGRQLQYIDCVVRQTFHYATFIAVCTFLEESLKLMSQLAVKDYKQRLKDLKEKGKKGNWLSSHRALLSQLSGVNISDAQGEWDLMAQFVPIRNCIAHAWGNLANGTNHSRIRQIVRDLSAQYSPPYLEITADQFIWVNDDAISACIVASSTILDKLFTQIFNLKVAW